MKLSLIAVIAVGIVIAIVTAGFSYQPAYNQNCVEEGGKITGFLKCTQIREDFDQVPNKFTEKPEILEFDYAHKISEPMVFSVKKSGFGCGFTIMARVYDKETSEQLWVEQADRICPSFAKDEEYSLVIDFPQNNYPDLVINKVGDYILEIESEGAVIEDDFIVRENASGGSIDRTVSPINEPDAEPEPEPIPEADSSAGPIILNEKYFQALFDNYDLIIDGTVTFHTGDRNAEYKIMVHEYLKNDLGLDEINAISNRSYTGFMTGDHALFYLSQVNSTWWEISKDSISLVNQDCTDARVVLNIPYNSNNACWSREFILEP
jgi:hypothetical protein